MEGLFTTDLAQDRGSAQPRPVRSMALVAWSSLALTACDKPAPANNTATVSAAQATTTATSASAAPEVVSEGRGSYLVMIGGCNDCHTPKKMGPQGPEPDPARLLSGHQADDVVLPPPRLGQGPWIAATTGSMTAWFGPWGISYASNITSDQESGLGKWTESDFTLAMRTGKHAGGAAGRRILPPMPWQNLASLTDADLKSIWAYLNSIPAIRNRVPNPVPPTAKPSDPAGLSSRVKK